ncbi:MAG: GntP family permease [Azospirillum sp.]|nr:GntP family permease [Azospirillum sp.]
MGVIGIVLSLLLLMYLAYRGINVLVLAPCLALMAVVFAGDTPLLATYTQLFMVKLGGYVITYFPIFMLGAIFGKLMDDSGAARVIAHWVASKTGAGQALLAIVLACGILTYGGVSLFVVAFAVYPIGNALLREADIPKRLIPGAIALGSFTFTMTALPGTPAIQNNIPSPFFGTDGFAAPGLGTIAGLIMIGLGILWLNMRAKAAKARGEGYGDHPLDGNETGNHDNLPPLLVALLPIILVVVLNFAFTKYIIPMMDTGYLADAKYGKTTIDAVRGNWSIIAALVFACVAAILINLPRWRNLKETVNTGTMGSLLPIFNTASEVGYGSVIASLAAFVLVRDAVLAIPGNPLISEAVAVNVLAGITGSASGGMSIALQTLGKTYLELGTAAGISPELLHRVATLSSGGFDSLPHNGAVITLLSICKLTHRQSYVDIGVCSVLVPVISLITVIVLGSMFGSF